MAYSFTLQTSDSVVASGDVIGRLAYAASNEASAGDAVRIAGMITSEAEGDFTAIANPASLVFSTSTSADAVEQMRLTSEGYLGINTPYPQYQLDVNGTLSANSININDAFTFPTADGSPNQYLKTDGAGNVSWSTVAGGGGSIDGSGVTNYTAKWSDTDTLTSGIIYDNGTQVGIGTNSPAPAGGDTALHIHATSYPELKLTNDTTGSTAADGSLIQLDGNNLNINNRENGRVVMYTNNTLAVDVSRFGTVGIGRTGVETTTVYSFHETTDNPAITTTYGHFMQDVVPSGTPTSRVHYSSIVGMYASDGADMATWIGYTFSNSATSTANIDNTYGFYSPIVSGIGSLTNYSFISGLNDDPTKTNRAFHSGGTAISWFGRGAFISTAGALGRNYQLSMPAGGVNVTAGNQTGYLKIRLPERISDGEKWTNTMCWFTVEVYEYSTGKSKTFKFGGYTYSTTERWLNTTATLIAGGSETTNYKVQFVNDPDGYPAVLISGPDEHTHVWSYPQVNITQATLGYTNAGFDEMWRGEFEISYVTDSDLDDAGYTQIVEQGFYKTVTSNFNGDIVLSDTALDITDEGYQITLRDTSSSNELKLGSFNTAGLIEVDSSDSIAASYMQFNVDGNTRMQLLETSNAINYSTTITSTDGSNVSVFGNTVNVFNEDGNNIDFRVEGDTDQNLLFADASSDRVGIGTSSPAAKLHVLSATSPEIRQTNTNTAGNITHYLYSDNTNLGGLLAYGSTYAGGSVFGVGASGVTLFSNGGGDLGVGTFGGPGNLRLGTAGIERIRVTSSGNVGVGTLSPAAKLDVEGGTIRAGGGVLVPLTQSYTCYTANYGMGTPNSNGLQIFTSDGDRIRWGHKDGATFTDRMVLTPEGKFGVATTGPTVDVEIGSNTSTVRALSLRHSSVPAYLSNGYDGTYSRAVFSTNRYSDSSGVFGWSDAANVNFSTAAIDLTTNAFGGGSQIRFYTATVNNTEPTERMHIDGDGRVGIGTSSPSYKVVVDVGASSYEGLAVQGTNLPCVAVVNGGIESGMSSPSAGVLNLVADAFRNEDIATSVIRFLPYATHTATLSTDGLIITGDLATDVGTVPSGILHAVGTYHDNPHLRLTDSETHHNFDIHSSGTIFEIDVDPDNANAGSELRINVDDVNVLTIKDDKVGIGTTTPSGKLDVFGGDIVLTSGELVFGNGATTSLEINDLGNVNISAPTTNDSILRYDAGLNEWIDDLLDLALIKRGSTPFPFYSDTQMGYYYNWTQGSEAVVNEGGNNIDFRVEGDTDEDLLFVDASTDRVGIGTSSPSVKLDVNGTIKSTNPDNNKCTVNANSVVLKLQAYDVASANDVYIGSETSSDLFIVTGNQNRININSTGGIVINEAGINADVRIEGDSDENLLFIDASTDSIGIGTNAPNYKLHVQDSDATSTTVGTNILARLQSNASNADGCLQFSDGVSNASLIGQQAGGLYCVTGGAERLRIGSAGAITFNDEFTFPTTDGSANQVLTTDGSGNVSWASSQYLNITKSSLTENVNQTTAQAIRFDSEISKDSIYTHSTSTNPERVTVTEDGIYIIKANIGFNNTGAQRVAIRASVYKNGTEITQTRASAYNRGSTFGDDTNFSIGTILDLNASDYIELYAVREYADQTNAANTVVSDCELTMLRVH